MGIEAAILGAAGIGLVGNVIAGKGQKAQAEAAADAAQANLGFQQQQFQQGLELAQPYIQAGQQGLQGLQAFTTPEGQQQYLNQYTQSPLYQAQIEAGSENVLRNASATGALRTGQADFALGGLPIAIQQQALAQQEGRLQGLAGMGASATGQAFGGFQNLGQTGGQAIQQAGAYQGMANAAPWNAFAGGLTGLSGLGLAYGMGAFNPTPAGTGYSYNAGSI